MGSTTAYGLTRRFGHVNEERRRDGGKIAGQRVRRRFSAVAELVFGGRAIPFASSGLAPGKLVGPTDLERESDAVIESWRGDR